MEQVLLYPGPVTQYWGPGCIIEQVLRGPYQWARYRLGLLTLKTGFCQQRAVFMCIEHGVIVYLYIVLA